MALTPEVNASRKSALVSQRGTSRSLSSDFRRLGAANRAATGGSSRCSRAGRSCSTPGGGAGSALRDDLLLAEREQGAGELALHQGEVPGVGVPRRVDVDVVERDHVAPEDHRLEVEAAARRGAGSRPGEQVAVDLLLAPGAVLLGRAEVLEGAEAGDGVEAAEGVAGDLPRVVEVDVEAVAPAGRGLRGGQRDAHAAWRPGCG